MARAILRLDRVEATKTGAIESVVANVDLEQGCVVHLGDFVAGEKELRQAVVPTATSITTDEVVLIASDERQIMPVSPQDYYIPANTPVRALHLRVGDYFTITADGLVGTPVVGRYVVPQAGSTKLAVAADLTGGTRFAGKILAQTKLHNITAYTIQVIKA